MAEAKLKIELHPSGLGGFFDCSYRWYRDNIFMPQRTITSAAHIGTAIHKSAETFYKDCIASQKWEKYNSAYEDAAIESFKNRIKDDEPVDIKDLNMNDTLGVIKSKQRKYVEKARDLNAEQIPVKVESNYKIPIKTSPNLELTISGTLDIVGESSISDIKTMQKLNNPQKYWLQQGIYAILLEREEKLKVDDLKIHRVLTNKDMIDCVSICNHQLPAISVETIKERVQNLIKSLRWTLETYAKSGDDYVFRGNPQSMLCSPKYCAYYADCKYRGV